MSSLAEHLESYLTIRRALGFKLINEERMLNDFAAFADAAGEPHDHDRDRALLGQAATARMPRLPGAADARGARLRPLPARAGPVDRGPAA